MDDFDFTKPPATTPATPAPAAVAASAPFKAAASRFYDPTVAERIFCEAGREERFAAGGVVFEEDQKAVGAGLFRKASRMYFILEGDVALSIGGKPLDVLKKGEIVGEMAVISGRPRSATAVAKSDTRVCSLDAEELKSALGRSPEFALMLASVMFDRLRFLAARLATRKVANAVALELSVFDGPTLARFEAALPRASTVRHFAGATVMREGQSGAFMYVVKDGRVDITIRGNLVEVAAPGGTFGEMAVVDTAPRTATAIAREACELLQVDRPSLLAAVKRDPSFAMALLWGVSERLRYMNAQLA